MREMYTLELIQLVEELSAIEGFYIDQFYETEKNRFRLKLSKSGEKANLQCILPYAMNRTDTIQITEEASNFSMAVRKKIAGLRIKSVMQYNNDRIIIIKVEKSDSEVNMIFEMFGRGNFVVTDGKMKILLAYQVHSFKDRAIKPNATYIQPKNQAAGPFDEEAIKTVIKNIETAEKGTALLSYLSKRLAIGFLYVEEAIGRAELKTATKLSELNEKNLQALEKEVLSIIKECTKKAQFLAYIGDNVIVDYALCKIGKYSSLEVKEFKSFESCLEAVYEGIQLEKEGKNEEEEKTKASIEKQRLFLEEIDNEIEQNKNAGSYIMNNMHEINELIQKARSKKNPEISDIKSAHNTMEILSINTKTKTIKIKAKHDENNA